MNNYDPYMEIPETYTRRKLNAMYREIPLKDTTFRLLRKYFNAMAHLYGVIPLRQAFEIVSSQCPALVTKTEFFAFAEIARHECEDYCIMKDTELYSDGLPGGRLDWKIVDIPLLYDENNALGQINVGQAGKPYFIPPKDKLLAYRDPAYCEPTPQAKKLHNFLSQRLYGESVDAAFEDILMYTRSLFNGMQKVIDSITRYNAVLTDKDVREFAAIYQDFHNHTRMQYNRGFTPVEMRAVMEKKQNTIPKSVPFVQPAKPRKTGRNEPCPCGSGKKYKKCCGR